MELPYAGLQLMCSRLMTEVSSTSRSRSAMRSRRRSGCASPDTPNPLLVGLAVLGLLTQAASDGPLLCIVDDAQWLDERLRTRGRVCGSASRCMNAIAVIMAMRQVDERFADLPQLTVGGLGDEDARAAPASKPPQCYRSSGSSTN